MIRFIWAILSQRNLPVINAIWMRCGLFQPSVLQLKANQPGVSGKRRYEMVSAAIEGNTAFRALDVELKRGGISYSYDTVIELQRLYPDYTFAYIIGSDRIHDLAHWDRIDQLASLVTFIGLERPSDTIQINLVPEFLKNRLQLISMPAIGI